MIYWGIASFFFLASLAGCLYSMFSHEEYDNLVIDVIKRAGACLLFSCAWPIIAGLAIFLAVADFMGWIDTKR